MTSEAYWRAITENRSTMYPTMYDAVTATNIPAPPNNPPPTIVAGYVDGFFAWTAEDWALFPTAYHVQIAVEPAHLLGEVLDVESGNATPEQAPDWVQARRGAGVDPVVYCSQSTWAEIQQQFDSQHVPQPHYWIANWDNQPTLIAGAIAHQYKNDLAPGYDVSVVDPTFRWAMSTPPPPPPPTGGFQVSSMPTIQSGSTGNVVKTAQACMVEKSGQHIAVDGVFGPATVYATENVQRFFGLTADGIIGPETWGALLLL